jgi:hypothetical protein
VRKTSRYLFFLVLLSVFLNCGCGPRFSTANNTSTPTFPVVVFSDIHFNPLDNSSGRVSPVALLVAFRSRS